MFQCRPAVFKHFSNKNISPSREPPAFLAGWSIYPFWKSLMSISVFCTFQIMLVLSISNKFQYSNTIYAIEYYDK